MHDRDVGADDQPTRDTHLRVKAEELPLPQVTDFSTQPRSARGSPVGGPIRPSELTSAECSLNIPTMGTGTEVALPAPQGFSKLGACRGVSEAWS